MSLHPFTTVRLTSPILCCWGCALHQAAHLGLQARHYQPNSPHGRWPLAAAAAAASAVHRAHALRAWTSRSCRRLPGCPAGHDRAWRPDARKTQAHTRWQACRQKTREGRKNGAKSMRNRSARGQAATRVPFLVHVPCAWLRPESAPLAAAVEVAEPVGQALHLIWREAQLIHHLDKAHPAERTLHQRWQAPSRTRQVKRIAAAVV